MIHVGLSNNLPVREGFGVNVGISPRKAFVVEREGVDLRDSEGFRFTVTDVQRENLRGDEDIRFLIDTDESIVRIRYNDPTYYVTLRLTYEHKGKKEVIDIPRINPIVKRPPPG